MRNKLKKPCTCGSTDNPHTCFGFEPKNKPERTVGGEMAEAIYSTCFSGKTRKELLVDIQELLDEHVKIMWESCKKTLQAERQKREEMVEWAEREVYALSETLKKSKEMVSVGHKKVYNHIKIVGELEGKLEVWQEILQALTQPNNPKE